MCHDQELGSMYESHKTACDVQIGFQAYLQLFFLSLVLSFHQSSLIPRKWMLGITADGGARTPPKEECQAKCVDKEYGVLWEDNPT
jgi:hypothetical protein